MKFAQALFVAIGAFVALTLGLNFLDFGLFLSTGFHLMNDHKRRLGAWGLVIFLAVAAGLMALGAAPSRGATPPPVAFPVPGPPPISAGPVTVVNGHLCVAGQRAVFFGVGFDASAIWGLLNPKNGVWQLDPNQCAVYSAELNRMFGPPGTQPGQGPTGATAVRILGLSASNINPIFAAGSGVQLDAAKVSALQWFLQQLAVRNVRYLIANNSYRVITPADLPAGADPLAQEAVAQSWLGNPVGRLAPWDLYSPTLQQLEMDFDAAIAKLVNNDPACLGFELDNEDPVIKDNQWGFKPPQLQSAFVADATTWASANCGGINKFGGPQHPQYFAYAYGKKCQTRRANLRQYTAAVIIDNTWFGNGSYAMLAPMISQADPQSAISMHFYTRGPPSDTNGFLNGRVGQTPPDTTTRFTACLAGCNWGKPLLVTEFGPQFQSGGNAFDPPQELVVDLPAATWQMVWQDCDACFCYSWAANPIWFGGTSAKSGPYDLRNVPQFVRAMKGCSDIFHDLSLRASLPTVTIAPTNGLYGNAGTPYLIYGPYTDPALYAIPPGTKVLMQQGQAPAPAASGREPRGLFRQRLLYVLGELGGELGGAAGVEK